MLVDLEINEGEWFSFQSSKIDPLTGEPVFDDPVSDAKVQVRSMASFFEERISARKRQVEHVMNPKTRQMERVSFYAELSPDDAKKERDDAYDYAIMDFSGFKNSKTSKEIECTRDNKIALMKLPVFDRFFARCQQLLASSGIKEKEEAEKKILSNTSNS